MRVELLKPLKKPAKIRVTYNDKELFTKDFAAGETPQLNFETPAESGEGQAFLIFEGQEPHPVGMAQYIFDDIKGAKMLLAMKIEDEKSWAQRARLGKAIGILEKLAPDSDDLAEAYLSMCWVHYELAEKNKRSRARHRQEAIAWYEKAIATWERSGNTGMLRGNLTNISSLYDRYGDAKTAYARAMRGLKMERERVPFNPEGLAAWTHGSARCLAVGKIAKAERIAKEGLKRFDGDPNCAYLWNLLAQIHTARAKIYREKAEAMLPPESCPI